MWGFLAQIYVPIPNRVKIRPKNVNCVFIRYVKYSMACRFLAHKSKRPYIQDNTVMESHNVEYYENIYLYKTRLESSSGGSKQPQEKPKENETNEEGPRHSKCQRKTTSF